jgi:hypothetical protein
LPNQLTDLTGVLGDATRRATDAGKRPIEKRERARNERESSTHSFPRMNKKGSSDHGRRSKTFDFFRVKIKELRR